MGADLARCSPLNWTERSTESILRVIVLPIREHPFGAVHAVTSVREYDPKDGDLVRVFSPKGKAEFRKPRGLRFAPNGVLYCVARDEVVGFDFASGEGLGAVARLPRLNGQALEFFPC
jgi:hypothetical protein